MAKIAFIGAGSFGFTRTLVKDILTFSTTEDAELCLMDIDEERLDYITRAVQRIVDEGARPAKVTATTDRRKALKGADAVLVTILAGGVQVWRHDIEIPKKYGVDTNVGDTRGPSGIFRALRTIPVMVSICKDMEELCPKALLLNYTNPMAMLCRAMQRETSIVSSGLCHSVQGTAHMLANWIGAPMDEITYVCAGINHLSWFVKYEWNGEDAYPLLKAAMKKKIRDHEQVRNAMFMALGYYVTESSGHNSEYNWWFRKRPDLIEKYCTDGTGWNPGEYAYIVKSYLARGKTWKKDIQGWLDDPAPLNLARGHEYAASIINAWLGGDSFEFNGNVPNTGIITNLPQNCCVEVPVFASKRALNPVHVGELPATVQPITALSASIEEMTVEAALTGNPELVYQAICYDPLTAAVCGLDEIKRMVKAMLKKNAPHLPQFETVTF
ncbi:MAG TPA: alpha-galactosidase [Armatimonadota bacterium]|nr:alpha-galactosidase [Armatimonadota bacterium]